jgi:hypothetical protein
MSPHISLSFHLPAPTPNNHMIYGAQHFGRYTEYKMKVAFSQLKFNCTSCDAFSDFFSNAETILQVRRAS